MNTEQPSESDGDSGTGRIPPTRRREIDDQHASETGATALPGLAKANRLPAVRPLISYAQNGEDIVLHRLFHEQAIGRYIDVGAGHPEFDSVTKLFYDRGWRGVNIEPSPIEYSALEAARPGDVNLAVAVSDHVGTAPLYLGSPEQRGLGSLDAAVAERSLGDTKLAVEVPVTTLARICREHVSGPIDFLKIDVEGLEEAVIMGADWVDHRPRVVIVEATEPNSTAPSHQRWEQALLHAGYALALFDGLNRFYAAEDDDEGLAILAVPANVHDRFIRNDLHLLTERLVVLERQSANLPRLEMELERFRRIAKRIDRLDAEADRRTSSDDVPDWYERDFDDDSDAFFEIPGGPSNAGGNRV